MKWLSESRPRHEGGGGAALERMTWLRKVLVQALYQLTPSELGGYREDLCQAALVRVLEVEAREREPVRTASYLWYVAHAVIADELRRQHRAREKAMEMERLEAQVTELHSVPPMATPGLREALQACLEELPASRRPFVVLHLQGFTPSEASRVLNTEIKRVENLTYRGLEALRRRLAARGYAP